jgi:hypothetical protein
MPTGPGSYRATASPAGARTSGRHPAPLMRTSVRDRPGKGLPPVQTRCRTQNLLLSWTTAAELPKVPLADALALLLLALDQQPWRFEKAAPRWHARLCDQAQLTLPDAQLALAALHALAGPRRCRRRSGSHRVCAVSIYAERTVAPGRTAGVSWVRDPVSRRVALVEEQAAPPLGAALPQGQVRRRAREAANSGQSLCPRNAVLGGKLPVIACNRRISRAGWPREY